MKKQNQLSENISGIIPVDKPSGLSSFSVVKEVKKSLKLKNVGHSGTLDPMAEGVLVLLSGGATKIVPYIKGWNKEYLATAKLGVTTDTDDAQGKVVCQKDIESFDSEFLEQALAKFTGEIEQIPPVYSAKKYKGKAHYKYARQGIEVQRKPSIVNVASIELTKYDHPDITFKIICSTGTYVRSICRDIGQSIGTGAMLKKLIRTRNGPFNLENAFNYSDLVDKGTQSRKNMIMIKPEFFPLKNFEVDASFEEIINAGGIIRKNAIKSPDKINFKRGDLLTLSSDKGSTIGIFESMIPSSMIDSIKDHEFVLRARRVFN